MFLPAGGDESSTVKLTRKEGSRQNWEDTLWVGGGHFYRFSGCHYSDGLQASTAYTPTEHGQGHFLWVELHEDYPKP